MRQVFDSVFHLVRLNSVPVYTLRERRAFKRAYCEGAQSSSVSVSCRGCACEGWEEGQGSVGRDLGRLHSGEKQQAPAAPVIANAHRTPRECSHGISYKSVAGRFYGG